LEDRLSTQDANNKRNHNNKTNNSFNQPNISNNEETHNRSGSHNNPQAKDVGFGKENSVDEMITQTQPSVAQTKVSKHS